MKERGWEWGIVDTHKDHKSVSSHIVNVVQSPMRQGCPLLQPQVSTDEQFSSRDRRRVLRIGQALHHHCGHPLQKHKGKNALL